MSSPLTSHPLQGPGNFVEEKAGRIYELKSGGECHETFNPDIHDEFTSRLTAAVVTCSRLHQVRPDEILPSMGWVGGSYSMPHSLLRRDWLLTLLGEGTPVDCPTPHPEVAGASFSGSSGEMVSPDSPS